MLVLQVFCFKVAYYHYMFSIESGEVVSIFEHNADPARSGLVQLWDTQVRRPCTAVLRDYYPLLKRSDRLGELFCYQSVPE